MDKKIKEIGVVVMYRISDGGGGPRVAVDLINSLKELGYEINLFYPHKLDKRKVEELYGDLKIDGVFGPSKIKQNLSRHTVLARKLLKKDFKEFAKNMDMIFDIDGGVFHNHLPRGFDKKRYVIWRISCVNREPNPWMKKNLKSVGKEVIVKILNLKPQLNKHIGRDRIYCVDKWTVVEMKELWDMPSEGVLYHEIKTDDLKYDGRRKKNQIAVLGRILPNKMIENSIKIFYEGTKKFQDYELVILGGATSFSDQYLVSLNSLIKNLGISKRVKIIKDPPFEKIKDVLLNSKILIDSQRAVSITMTAVEALAAGCMVLAYKNAGTYIEALDNGKYGFGFNNVKEGSIELEKIIDKLNKKELKPNMFYKRADFFSKENFVKQLRGIIKSTEAMIKNG